MKLFRKDIKASVASEFALIAPIMMLLWVGVVEISQALMVKRKIVSATQSAADLISRETEVDDAQVDDIVEAVKMIFYPMKTDGVSINISSVVFDAGGDPSIDWERVENEPEFDDPILSDVTGLGSAGDSVVVVTVTYNHQLLFPTWFGNSYNFYERAYTKPRRSSKVTYIE